MIVEHSIPESIRKLSCEDVGSNINTSKKAKKVIKSQYRRKHQQLSSDIGNTGVRDLTTVGGINCTCCILYEIYVVNFPKLLMRAFRQVILAVSVPKCHSTFTGLQNYNPWETIIVAMKFVDDDDDAGGWDLFL